MSDYDEGIASGIGDYSVPKVTSNCRATPIECSSLEDLQNQLRRVLETTSLALIPPLVSIDLYLNSNATFNLRGAVEKCLSNQHDGPKIQGVRAETLNDGAILDPETNTFNELSMTEVLKATDDPKVRIKLQAVVARQILTAIRDVDGFGYGVQSDFDSKKNGHRFTFACHDSIWNKERRRRARGLGKSQEESGSNLSMRPTFNCGGEVIVRFQRTLSRIDVSYAHMAIHRNIASRRSQARSRPRRSHHTSQRHSLTGRGALDVAKEPQTDAQENNPLVPLNEAAPQITAESQSLSEIDQEESDIGEDRPVSRYPSSPLSDVGPPDGITRTLGTRTRQRIRGSNALIPSYHKRKGFKTFKNTAHDQLNPITSTSAEAVERNGAAQQHELLSRGQRDSSGGMNNGVYVPSEDMLQRLPDAENLGYIQPIDPKCMSTFESQHMEHPDWLPSPKLTSNGTATRRKGVSKHGTKTSRPAVQAKRRKG